MVFLFSIRCSNVESALSLHVLLYLGMFLLSVSRVSLDTYQQLDS